jgi:hypothetical protein
LKLLSLFDSSYDEVPALRLASVAEHDEVCAELRTEGLSFRTKIIPPRGRTHRRPKGRPREIIVMLVSPYGG